MSVTIIGSACSEPARQDLRFGLCDDENSTKAYSDLATPKKWIATVVNEDQVDVIFTPIDFCITISKENTNDQERTCDGMLTTDQSLYLVELKNVQGDWIPDATDQLIKTINIVKANHDITGYRYKKACACNRKRRHFKTMEQEKKLRFLREHGFRLDIQAEIRIK
jgi:hypothetical protein